MGAEVFYRELWGEKKSANLLASLGDHNIALNASYKILHPTTQNRHSLRYGDASSAFVSWPDLVSIAKIAPINGLFEKRGGSLLSMDRAALHARMQEYLDSSRTFEVAAHANPILAVDRARYDAKLARQRILNAEGFRSENIRRYALCVFDTRWAYVSTTRPLWNEPRPSLLHIISDSPGFLICRPQQTADPEGMPTFWSSVIGDDYLMSKHAFFFPVVENLSGAARANLSPAALAWTTALGLPPDAETSRLVWHHALAATYSPAYLAENAEGIRQGWPRIPLPGDPMLLRASAALGANLALLLDSETPVPGVTEGSITPALTSIAVPSTLGGAARDWHLTGWGSRTEQGVTMPGRGQTTARPYAGEEQAAQAEAALLGARTLDVHMNGASFWRNIPEKVWETHIGGYQVIKKWLSYRDRSILDRALHAEEVAHVQSVARRIAAILLMGPALDDSFRACAAAHVPLRQIGVEGPGN